MNTLTAHRKAIAGVLEGIPGFTSYWFIPASPTVPAIAIRPDPPVTIESYRGGSSKYTYVVQVLAGLLEEENAQELLDDVIAFSGDRSVYALLEAGDRTLGGTCSDFVVEGLTGYGPVTFSGHEFIGAEITITVYVEGT